MPGTNPVASPLLSVCDQATNPSSHVEDLRVAGLPIRRRRPAPNVIACLAPPPLLVALCFFPLSLSLPKKRLIASQQQVESWCVACIVPRVDRGDCCVVCALSTRDTSLCVFLVCIEANRLSEILDLSLFLEGRDVVMQPVRSSQASASVFVTRHDPRPGNLPQTVPP